MEEAEVQDNLDEIADQFALGLLEEVIVTRKGRPAVRFLPPDESADSSGPMKPI